MTVNTAGWRRSGKIMVVEEVAVVRTFVKEALERSSFNVLTAKDGTEAIETFRERPQEIKLVVLDWGIPPLDGYVAMESLRQVKRDVGLVIMSGGHRDWVAVRIAGRIGFDFLQKPFSSKQLVDVVRKALSRGISVAGSPGATYSYQQEG